VIAPLTGPLTERPLNDRWPGDSDATWGNRPGIVASVLRYRVIVLAATVLPLRVAFTQVASERYGRGLPVPRGEPAGAEVYIDRLVSTDSGMVLPWHSGGPTVLWTWATRCGPSGRCSTSC
jgi:hypothetical protein